METIKVRIKTWEQMEKKYGLTNDEIYIKEDNQFFSHYMEDVIPEDRVIEVEVHDSSEFTWFDGHYDLHITPGMIEEESKLEFPPYFV